MNGRMVHSGIPAKPINFTRFAACAPAEELEESVEDWRVAPVEGKYCRKTIHIRNVKKMTIILMID